MKKPLSSRVTQIAPSSTIALTNKINALKAQGINVLGFGIGEPDFDTPDNIKEAAIDAIRKGHTKYTPSSGTLAVRNAICKKLKEENGIDYKPSQIVVSNGAKHSIYNALCALVETGEEVIVPAPYWVSYPEMVKMAGGVPVFVDADESTEYKMTAEMLQKAITPNTKCLILNSPSNPTGMLYSKQELIDIARICVKEGVYVISDEVYEALVFDGEFVSFASLGEDVKDITIVINAVSKTYAMTGWRIGYTASNEEIAKAMDAFQSHSTSNPNSIAQMAAVEAYNGPQESVATMKKAFLERRDYLVERVNSVDNISCIKPDGAFYVVINVSKFIGKTVYGKYISNADDFCDVLLSEAKLALISMVSFGKDDGVRWSYASSMEEIKEGMDRLESFVKGANL